MPVTLVTGLPGHGKTLFTIQAVETLRRKSGRPVFMSGIPELTLPWVEISEPQKWYECEDGAIIVIDEAQRLFRPSGSGSKVGPEVAMFETHRHKGHDVYLITQHPTLIHSNIRKLVDRHVHVFRGWGLQEHTIYEWPEVQNPNSSQTRKTCAQKSTVRFNREVYSWYKSSTMHTVQRNLPVKLLVILGLLLMIVVGCLYYAVSSTYQTVVGGGGKKQQSSQSVSQLKGQGVSQSVASVGVVVDPRALASMLVPVVPGVPATAPLYQQKWMQVASVPVVSGCVASRDGCVCYTQQATRADVPADICRVYLEKPAFNHLRPDSQGGSGGSLPSPESNAPAQPDRT